MKILEGFKPTNDTRIFLDSWGRTYTFENKDFNAYLAQRKLRIEDIRPMSPDKKMEFFLKFKHGLSDPNANRAIEETKVFLYNRDKDVPLEQLPEDLRLHIKLERETMAYFDSIKALIGLASGAAKARAEALEQPNWSAYAE